MPFWYGIIIIVTVIMTVKSNTKRDDYMNKEYGYGRISTGEQNVERQVRNILAAYPSAIIVKEIFTGTKFQGRKELDKILSKIQTRDTIIFDSFSRMSRNAEEGFSLYEELFTKGVNLVFLKEPHINTDTYRRNRFPTWEFGSFFYVWGINLGLLFHASSQIQQHGFL